VLRYVFKIIVKPEEERENFWNLCMFWSIILKKGCELDAFGPVGVYWDAVTNVTMILGSIKM